MNKNFQILLIFTSIITIYSCKKSETTTTNTISYSKFKINSVTLNAFPSTDNNGYYWDGALGIAPNPDVYFNIDSSSVNLYNGSATSLNDIVASSLPISWPPLPSPQVINDLSATYSITLYDSDSPITSDDLMGQIPFVMNDHKTGYPSSFQINNGTSTVTIIGTWY